MAWAVRVCPPRTAAPHASRLLDARASSYSVLHATSREARCRRRAWLTAPHTFCTCRPRRQQCHRCHRRRRRYALNILRVRSPTQSFTVMAWAVRVCPPRTAAPHASRLLDAGASSYTVLHATSREARCRRRAWLTAPHTCCTCRHRRPSHRRHRRHRQQSRPPCLHHRHCAHHTSWRRSKTRSWWGRMWAARLGFRWTIVALHATSWHHVTASWCTLVCAT